MRTDIHGVNPSGQTVPLKTDANNNLNVNLGTYISGEDYTNDVLKVEQQMSYQNITTNTTTTIKSGAGFLKGFTVNNPAQLTVAALTIAVYDNTAGSGTLIGTFTVPFGVTTALPFKIEMNAKFTTGLTVVTSGPTVTGNLSFYYR